MLRSTLEELYARAASVACYYGKAHLADDFKSWYIIKILEGKSKNQLIKHAFIDFIREEIAPATRSKLAAIKQSKEPEIEPSIEDQMDAIKFGETYMGLTESVMCYLLAIEGYTLKEIGKMYGKTESRISQMFTKIGIKNRKIRKNRDNKEG